MFRDNQRLRLRKIEHLPRGMAGGRRSGQGISGTGRGEMIDGGTGVFCPAECLAGMAFCPPVFLPDRSRRLLVRAGFFLQAIAGGWFAAVGTVQTELAFQFGDPRL